MITTGKEEKEELKTAKMDVLTKVDFSRKIAGIPIMPKSIRIIVLITRMLPAVIQLGLGFALFTNPESTALSDWIYRVYGVSEESYALWCAAFSIMSVWWSVTGFWRTGLAIRVGGNVIFTFPLLFFVICTIWYVLVVHPDSTRTVIVMYSSLYISIMFLYLLNSALAVWFEDIRRGKGNE